MRITAAISGTPGDPFEIASCELADPQAGEVLVRLCRQGTLDQPQWQNLLSLPHVRPRLAALLLRWPTCT